jgi:Fe2+ transport system protein FeoA
MTKYLVLDVETTTTNKGSPFSVNNKLCYVGLYDGKTSHIFDIEYSDDPYRKKLEEMGFTKDEIIKAWDYLLINIINKKEYYNE